MSGVEPALHRAILCVDVEGFGDRRRTNPDQAVVRDGLYRSLRDAFTRSGVEWDACYHEDRGDGVLVLVSPDVPKNLLVGRVPRELAAALSEHNRAHDIEARIRLRMAVHAGEVLSDAHGVVGAAINVAFRLLEGVELKRALAASAGTLAVVASEWFFDEVIRHDPASDPAAYRQVQISVKETQTSAWIYVPGAPQNPTGLLLVPPLTVPRQLPGAIASFAGRTGELEELTAMLDRDMAAGGTVVISAIDGTAGIGKTAVALHWAHRVADRFPDGQLYVNLRGFDPAGSPMAPAEAVRGFLDALEVPAERIPISLEAQAALYRSLVSGRRILVVLDNARDVGQVRPLLPGSPGCLVVVTSRNHLTSLITVEGARPLTLDLLPVEEAAELLARRLGSGRLAAEQQAVEEIIALCAQLPLALSIVAARAAAHQRFPLAALAAELRDSRGGLDGFTDDDLTTDPRAVFSWSYQRLRTPAARLFRLLALHPGPDIATPAAASLAALPAHEVRNLLAELSRSHLLEEHIPGRFAFHDLLRAYAAELVRAHESDAERRATVHRILDHYLHSMHAANLFLHPRMAPEIAPHRRPGVTPQEFKDSEKAWAWFDTEYPVLLAVTRLACATGWDTYAWQLPLLLEDYFDRRVHRYDCVAAQRAALAAALRQKDHNGEAHAHYALGRASHWFGLFDEARTHLLQALNLFEELGDEARQVNTNVDLGHILEHQDRPAEALPYAQRALALSRATNNPDKGRALYYVGWYHGQLGDHQQMLTCCQQALAQNQKSGNRRGEGYSLNGIGYAHHHLGHYEQAIAYYQQALDLRSELADDSYSQAVSYNYLGDAYHAVGNTDAARHAWKNAMDVLDSLGHADVGHVRPDEIRAKLRPLDTLRRELRSSTETE
jgi:tetratricopeptide (TPR) repeat protein